jgi:regulator of replication initiation timing
MEKKIHHLEKEMYQLKRDNIELTKENKNILQMVSACEERLMYNDDETTVSYKNEKQQSKSDNTHDDDVRPYIDGKEDRSSINKDTTEEV